MPVTSCDIDSVTLRNYTQICTCWL